jgi:hypothetical protein
VREQLEHDRVIRLLQAKYKRKSEVAINPGNQQTMPVGASDAPWYPDLVLYANDRNHRLLGVVEVETAESVNNLEAMSQWATFSRLKVPFHLYVPISYIDVARRLCVDLQITPPEIWTYQAIGEQIRFAMVQKGAIPEPKYKPMPAAAVKAAPKPVPDKPVAEKPVAEKSAAAKSAPSPARPAAVKAAKPAPAKPAAAKPIAKTSASAPKAPVRGRATAAPARRTAPPPTRKAAPKAVTPAAKTTAKPAARKAAPAARPQKRR